MLLRTMMKFGLVVALSCAVACDPGKDHPGGGHVDIDGVELYDHHYPNTGESVRIFHDRGGAIHLVQVDEQGQLETDGQVHATLTPEALAILDDTVSEIASGTQLGAFDPSCLGSFDAPEATLSLQVLRAPLQFRYLGSCPPTLLVALDEMCRDLVLQLPTCSASPLFEACHASD